MLITLSQKSDQPLYQQVVDQIKVQILNGQLVGGEALPSIRSLAQELTTSVITIKRAYTELEQEGYIYTRQGLGSFVSEMDVEEMKVAQFKEVEQMLEEGVKKAIEANLSLDEIMKIVKRIYQIRGDY